VTGTEVKEEVLRETDGKMENGGEIGKVILIQRLQSAIVTL